MRNWKVPACLLSVILTAGCGRAETETKLCHIVMEEGDGYTAEQPAQTVEKGSDVVFTLSLEDGYEWEDEEDGLYNYTVRYDAAGRKVFLTVKNIQYSETFQAYVKKSGWCMMYDSNGEGISGKDSSKDSAEGIGGKDSGSEDGKEAVRAAVVSRSHLRPNTSIGTDLFEREGYVQTGWNTRPDGSGTEIGLGSRVDYEEGMVLYAQWEPWTDAGCFSYEVEKGFAVITGYRGNAQTICIPASLDGYPVRRIAEYALEGSQCDTVVLPHGIYEIGKWAFQNSSLKQLYFYDDLMKVSDYAFAGCRKLSHVHINAIQEPVYSGSYFDTFQDKYDRLRMLGGKKKIVLFSGSSTRFGYDSARIDAAFPEYEVVNMGVFAYSPALPQLLLILDQMQEGDLLVDAPEFDAANRQFCSQKELDYAFFAMMESNYDTFARLDIREFSQVFTAYAAYNALRQEMEKKSYEISASDYDEEGNPAEGPSYNEYGDYIIYRPNAQEEQPIYGLAVNYTVRAFPEEQYIDPINRVFRRFLDKGVQVYVTYAPRNRYALSKESTREERARLHAYFQEKLIVPVISELEDSLYSGVYLYGTDNHLSTEGAAVRTGKLIEELRVQLGYKCNTLSELLP